VYKRRRRCGDNGFLTPSLDVEKSGVSFNCVEQESLLSSLIQRERIAIPLLMQLCFFSYSLLPPSFVRYPFPTMQSLTLDLGATKASSQIKLPETLLPSDKVTLSIITLECVRQTIHLSSTYLQLLPYQLVMCTFSSTLTFALKEELLVVVLSATRAFMPTKQSRPIYRTITRKRSTFTFL